MFIYLTHSPTEATTTTTATNNLKTKCHCTGSAVEGPFLLLLFILYGIAIVTGKKRRRRRM